MGSGEIGSGLPRRSDQQGQNAEKWGEGSRGVNIGLFLLGRTKIC